MTCIVGLQHEGKVTLGADNLATAPNMTLKITNPKVFLIQGHVFGVAGSGRVLQIIRHELQSLDLRMFGTGDDKAYSICNIIQELLADKKTIVEEDGVANANLSMMLGWNASLYMIDSSFQYIRVEDPFIACGSGEEYALGALYAQGVGGTPPLNKSSIKVALRAANKWSPGCGKGFKFVETKCSSG